VLEHETDVDCQALEALVATTFAGAERVRSADSVTVRESPGAPSVSSWQRPEISIHPRDRIRRIALERACPVPEMNCQTWGPATRWSGSRRRDIGSILAPDLVQAQFAGLRHEIQIAYVAE